MYCFQWFFDQTLQPQLNLHAQNADLLSQTAGHAPQFLILETKRTNFGNLKKLINCEIKQTIFGNHKIILEIKQTNFLIQKIISEIKQTNFVNQKIVSEIKQKILEIKNHFKKPKFSNVLERNFNLNEDQLKRVFLSAAYQYKVLHFILNTNNKLLYYSGQNAFLQV